MKPPVSRLRAQLIAIRCIHAAGAFVATTALLSLLATTAQANPPSGNGWTTDIVNNPTFSDEFNGVNPDGTGVDTTKWNYRTDHHRSGNHDKSLRLFRLRYRRHLRTESQARGHHIDYPSALPPPAPNFERSNPIR